MSQLVNAIHPETGKLTWAILQSGYFGMGLGGTAVIFNHNQAYPAAQVEWWERKKKDIAK